MKKQSTWVGIDGYDITLINFLTNFPWLLNFCARESEDNKSRTILSVFANILVLSSLVSSSVASFRFCVCAKLNSSLIEHKVFLRQTAMCFRSVERHERSSCLEWWRLGLCFSIPVAVVRYGPEFSRKTNMCVHPSLPKQTLSCYCFTTIRFPKWCRTEDWIKFKSLIPLLKDRSWRFLLILLFFYRETQCRPHASLAFCAIRSQSCLFHHVQRWKDNCKKIYNFNGTV